MRHFLSICFIVPLTCCAPAETPRGDMHYDHVEIDGYHINVTYRGGRSFDASGGEETHDQWVKYRQIRAVEVISLCRVVTAEYRKGSKLLHTTVDCPNPRV